MVLVLDRDEHGPLLIDAIPGDDVSDAPFDYANPDPAQLKVICFTAAQSTHWPPLVTLKGTEFEPGRRKKWQD